MSYNLSGKVALVTGGSRGIGAAIAKRLAREGVTVALTYVNGREKADAVVAEINAAGGQALAIQADAAKPEAVRAAVQRTVQNFDRLDILVNNAGIGQFTPIEEFSIEDFDATVAVNIRSVFVASQEAARYMREGGRIITIGSTNAERIPVAGGSVYAMSKAAVAGFTKGLARDLGPRGITVNNIQPGPVDTDMNPAAGEFAAAIKPMLALPRYAHVDEIANMVAFIASPESSYITGANLLIDGGFAA